ncbi:MAG: acylphosphatase [candidate division WOR-3 bacterium]
MVGKREVEGDPTWASVEVIVSGLVQGVGYRFFVQRVARSLNLTGYVMNLRGGKVKAIAEGPRASLFIFVEELKKGPPLASVEGIHTTWGEYRAMFRDFSIRFEQ